jgi:pyruvate/2-oxoglutarate dehydrogenase complex dihydrolipoamide dehydrogenase (E3) component
VTWVDKDGKESSDIFDTVITAIGRNPDTTKLGLDTVKVETSKNGENGHAACTRAEEGRRKRERGGE